MFFEGYHLEFYFKWISVFVFNVPNLSLLRLAISPEISVTPKGVKSGKIFDSIAHFLPQNQASASVGEAIH